VGAEESNSGDDFHFLWAASRALALIEPGTHSRLLVVEGLSAVDDADDQYETVDLTEYFGGEDFDAATTTVVSQLKYSTRHPDRSWTESRDSPGRLTSPARSTDDCPPQQQFRARHRRQVNRPSRRLTAIGASTPRPRPSSPPGVGGPVPTRVQHRGEGTRRRDRLVLRLLQLSTPAQRAAGRHRSTTRTPPSPETAEEVLPDLGEPESVMAKRSASTGGVSEPREAAVASGGVTLNVLIVAHGCPSERRDDVRRRW
jgi:hypothetical protein